MKNATAAAAQQQWHRQQQQLLLGGSGKIKKNTQIPTHLTHIPTTTTTKGTTIGTAATKTIEEGGRGYERRGKEGEQQTETFNSSGSRQREAQKEKQHGREKKEEILET